MTRYCPVETRFKRTQASRKHPSEEQSCEQVFVEVHNGSGMQIAVFWVDSNGEEVGKPLPYRFSRVPSSDAVGAYARWA